MVSRLSSEEKLLKEWCDSLLELQINEIKLDELHGGVMCPACHRIHGRCGDSIYPLTTLSHLTNDKKYLDAAEAVFDWTIKNMKMPSGGMKNDANSTWEGITVFFVIQLTETLLNHREILSFETITKWEEALYHGLKYLVKNIHQLDTNINYLISSAAAFALAGSYFEDNHYKNQAKQSAHKALSFFTTNNLIFGEGRPHNTVTVKNCQPIDIGYSVEESLNNLAIYAQLSQDKEVTEVVIRSLNEHLNFMLPDGAWDNSWGSRNYKWTYWGSRTSDGCQIAYGLFKDENPLFGVALRRNTQLLKEITFDGLLAGGPMYKSANQPICVHHTFCHAKSLAFLSDKKIKMPSVQKIKLPMEQERSKVKHYEEAGVYIFKEGNWRGTISEYDFVYEKGGSPTGGTMTMLYEKELGPIIAATTNHYRLVEENNMQLPKEYRDNCQIPRIEVIRDNKIYRSSQDLTAKLTKFDEEVAFKVVGEIRESENQKTIGTFNKFIELKENHVKLICHSNNQNAIFYLPLIISSDEKVVILNPYSILLQRKNGELLLQSTKEINIIKRNPSIAIEKQRVFNPVGGFETIPLMIKLNQEEVIITLEKKG